MPDVPCVRAASTALVIFDCDGVLVDSEAANYRVLAALITELGWPLGPDDIRERFQGAASPDIWAAVRAHVGVVPADIEARFRARQLPALAGTAAIPGAHALLSVLPVPFCVASNGTMQKMDVTLTASGLAPLVAGRIFSREAVARPKPAPDLFLHAARMMAAPPQRTVVVEDSAAGVRAARAAGMHAVGYAGDDAAAGAALAGAGADAVLTRLGDLLPLLAV